MYRGGLEPLPCRLGGGDIEGMNAAQHARLCADVVSMWRTQPLAVIIIDSDLNPVSYFARHGSGAQVAPTVTSSSDGGFTTVTITWENSYETEDGHLHDWFVRSAQATTNDSFPFVLPVRVSAVGGNTVDPATVDLTIQASGFPVGAHMTCAVYGRWGPERRIGDYGGSLSKRNDEREHPSPYAGQILTDIQSQRGSSYSKDAGTLVHAENVAISRFWAGIGYRMPEQLVANTTPSSADDALEYWSNVLGIEQKPGEPDWRLRDRMSVHYRSGSRGPTHSNILQDVSDLLGDTFTGLTVQHDGQLQTPGVLTYWPGVNDGPVKYDLGGGTWLSKRSQIIVNVKRIPSLSETEFNQLMNVDLFNYLDRAMPVWSSAQWLEEGGTSNTWGNSTWGGTVWTAGFDWNP